MTKSESLVVDSVHAQAAGKSLPEQIELFRAHARTTSRERIAAHLYECADELEAAQRRCHQLQINFKISGVQG